MLALRPLLSLPDPIDVVIESKHTIPKVPAVAAVALTTIASITKRKKPKQIKRKKSLSRCRKISSYNVVAARKLLRLHPGTTFKR